MVKRVELVRIEYNANDPYKRKSVMFNLNDDRQRELFIHVSMQENASDYIKRLIERDMVGSRDVVNTPPERVEQPLARPKEERIQNHRPAPVESSEDDFEGMLG